MTSQTTKPPTLTMDRLIRRLVVTDGGRLSSWHWYDAQDDVQVKVTSAHLAGLVVRGLLTPFRPALDQRHELTSDGLDYAVERGWTDRRTALLLDKALRPAPERASVAAEATRGAATLDAMRAMMPLGATTLGGQDHVVDWTEAGKLSAASRHALRLLDGQRPDGPESFTHATGKALERRGLVRPATQEERQHAVAGREAYFGWVRKPGGVDMTEPGTVVYPETPAIPPAPLVRIGNLTVDEVLHEVRELITAVQAEPAAYFTAEHLRLVDLVDGLDGALSRGYHLFPAAWTENRR